MDINDFSSELEELLGRKTDVVKEQQDYVPMPADIYARFSALMTTPPPVEAAMKGMAAVKDLVSTDAWNGMAGKIIQSVKAVQKAGTEDMLTAAKAAMSFHAALYTLADVFYQLGHQDGFRPVKGGIQ